MTVVHLAHIDPEVTRHDPPTDPRRRCPVCGRERTELAKVHADPFCSRECVSLWYSVRRLAGAYALIARGPWR